MENLQNAFPELSKVTISHVSKELTELVQIHIYYTLLSDKLNQKTFSLFVNNRLSKNKTLMKAVSNVYKTAAISVNSKFDNYNVFVVLKVGFKHVDFNVSADKYEVKVADEQAICQQVEETLLGELRKGMNIKSYSNKVEKFNSFSRKSLMEASSKMSVANGRIGGGSVDTYDKFQLRVNPNATTLESFYRSKDPVRFSGASASLTLEKESLTFDPNSGALGKQTDTEMSVEPKQLKKEQLPTKRDILSPNHNNEGIFELTIPQSSELLTGSGFLGCATPFEILLQNQSKLISFNSLFMLARFFEFETKKLIMDPLTETIFQLYEVESFVFEKDVFESFTINFDIDVETAISQLSANVTHLNNAIDNIFHLSPDFSKLKIIIPSFIQSFIEVEAVHFLLFKIAIIKPNLTVLSFPDALTKFFIWTLRASSRSFSFPLKRDMDCFYQKLLLEIKRRNFGYECTENDDFYEILDIKNSYKYFERC